MKRRVVITGLGIVSPVGIGISAAWDAIVRGRSGIGRVTRFDPAPYSSQIAGEVRGFDVTQYIPSKDAKKWICSFITALWQRWKPLQIPA
ncbi:beta-ketoacyl synthase N-terminal-like domain-containing protein [Acidithiobacillus thiooxidans]|uniref:beta-ketoacyl synthase N-terminal-like domain-containing protein n=1 Tax=Acidithiobacillus thiooxidans TaxID=930 RepID=UPI0020CB093F